MHNLGKILFNISPVVLMYIHFIRGQNSSLMKEKPTTTQSSAGSGPVP